MRHEIPPADSPSPPPTDVSFLATLDADTIALLVFTMVIAWALAQLTLIMWKKLREHLRSRNEESNDFDEARTHRKK